jgi:hypothetical protein
MCAVALALTLPIRAHHSHGNYNDGTIDVEGVVTEVHLVVPHSYVYINVKNGAETETWVLEATSRSGLEKIGVTKDYLKVGDAIKARCHRLRDGSTGCLLGYLKGPDGVVKDWDGGTGPVPNL